PAVCVISASSAFFFYFSGDHRALHSFPTRRSSDLFVLGLLIAGGVFHQTLTGAIATSAVASVVLGLALQETLGNFFAGIALQAEDRKSTRLNSSHVKISYAVFCLKKKKKQSKEKED